MSSHSNSEVVAQSHIEGHEKRFIVARNRCGAWVVADRMGQVGGLLISKEAACHFVFEQSFGHLEELDLVDEPLAPTLTHSRAA